MIERRKGALRPPLFALPLHVEILRRGGVACVVYSIPDRFYSFRTSFACCMASTTTGISARCRMIPGIASDEGRLQESADMPVSELSGGMKRRVTLARALLYPSSVILMDEPFKGLDEDTRYSVCKAVLEYARGKTMVIVTHEMAFARAVSEWVIFMDGGVIVEEGEPESLFGDPTQERTRQFLRNYQQ